VKEGKASEVECLEAWENLVRKQEKETGSNQFNTFLSLLKGYASLLNDHTVIRACLIHLMFAPVDWEVIQTLSKKGYEIDTTDRNSVVQSCQAGLQRCENLVTKATMKQKELQRMFHGREQKGEAQSFESVMAHLIAAMGFHINEDLTLARYNEYQKILKAKQKAIEENGRNKRK
jgi:hypothetical protein